MKIAILTAAALFATPLVAQTTPSTAPDAPSTAPASSDQTTTAVPNTPVATPNDPASTGQMPSPNGQAMPNGQMQPGQMQGGQMQGGQTAPMAGDTAPAASTGNLPYCRQGQYTGCREHSNAAGARVHKKSMRKR